MDLCNNLPEKLLDRLKRIYSDEEYEQVLQAFANKPLPSFRANPLKTNAAELAQKLKTNGFKLKQTEWYNDAFILLNRSIRELTETEEYKQGLLYIQNLSSMIPALVLDPQPEELVLDLAAAPGSKTTQLAALMKNQGLIVANDISRQRMYKMQTLLEQYGIPYQWQINTQGVYLISSRGETIWKKFTEYFDRALVDVPCTMEGRIQCDDPKTYEDWSTKKIKQLSMLQKYLLRSAISATKPGGTIVYSTCTLEPEENEEVIDWVLKREEGAIELVASNAMEKEAFNISDLPLKPGLTSWNKSLHPQLALTSRITPSPTMEGFFIAKIKKLRSTLPDHAY
jgi:NOL1/NOP2/sun family putative RNA methylase